MRTIELGLLVAVIIWTLPWYRQLLTVLNAKRDGTDREFPNIFFVDILHANSVKRTQVRDRDAL